MSRWRKPAGSAAKSSLRTAVAATAPSPPFAKLGATYALAQYVPRAFGSNRTIRSSGPDGDSLGRSRYGTARFGILPKLFVGRSIRSRGSHSPEEIVNSCLGAYQVTKNLRIHQH